MTSALATALRTNGYIKAEKPISICERKPSEEKISVGYFTNVGSDRYFYGAFFTREKNGYSIVGNVHMTQEKFFASVETWTEIF